MCVRRGGSGISLSSITMMSFRQSSSKICPFDKLLIYSAVICKAKVLIDRSTQEVLRHSLYTERGDPCVSEE